MSGANGGVAIILVLVGVFLGAIFGLYLTPEVATASLEASYAFNNSTYATILHIFYEMVIPILWACIMIAIMGGAGVGVYRVASRL